MSFHNLEETEIPSFQNASYNISKQTTYYSAT